MNELHTCVYSYRLGQALIYLHKVVGVLHRDFSRNNILVREKHGWLEISDFGFASMSTEDNRYLFGSGAALKLNFTYAPEMITERMKHSVSADVYAFGGILYFMATGREPFIDKKPEGDEQIQKVVDDYRQGRIQTRRLDALRLSGASWKELLSLLFTPDPLDRARAFDPEGKSQGSSAKITLMELVFEHKWFDLCRKFVEEVSG